MNRSNEQIKSCQDLAAVIHREVTKDITFDALENFEGLQFFVQFVNFPMLRLYPVFGEAVCIGSILTMITDDHIFPSPTYTFLCNLFNACGPIAPFAMRMYQRPDIAWLNYFFYIDLPVDLLLPGKGGDVGELVLSKNFFFTLNIPIGIFAEFCLPLCEECFTAACTKKIGIKILLFTVMKLH